MKSPTVWTHPPLEQWTQGGPIHAPLDGTKLNELEYASEARIGDPNAMGLFAFAVGTTLAAWILSGWVPMPAGFVALAPVLLLFAGVAQFVAGLYAFARTRSWAGTFLCSYGAIYAVIAASIWMAATRLVPIIAGDAIILAVGLFCAAYIALALTIGAARLNRSYALMAGLLCIGLALAGIQSLGSSRELGFLAGYFMLASAFFAFYAATAHVVNSAWQREALPLGTSPRRGRDA
ncbi:MAG: acetate uptake transporter [Candidatus Tyrphobacter sp.]